jgi:hypothetical protein
MVMEKMGWTYTEYMNTPRIISEMVIEKLKLDNKVKQDGTD